MFANSRSIQAQVMAPLNICTVAPYKIMAPLPNIALFAQVKTGSDLVSIQSQPVCTISDVIPLSLGDASSLPFGGGAISGKAMDASERTCASNKVFVKGKPVTRQTDPSMNNNKNALGTTLAPAQLIVMIFS